MSTYCPIESMNFYATPISPWTPIIAIILCRRSFVLICVSHTLIDVF